MEAPSLWTQFLEKFKKTMSTEIVNFISYAKQFDTEVLIYNNSQM